MSDFLFGNGKVYVGERNAQGRGTGMRWLGNCPAFSISLATEKVELKESYSGQNNTVASVQRGNTATVTATCSETTADNVALGLNGSVLTIAGASVTDADYGEVVAGELVGLPHANLTAATVVVKNGATTLDEGTDYTVNARHGSIQMITAATDLRVSYTYGASKQIPVFSQLPTNKFIRFEGINLDNGEAVVVELYKVSLNPLSELNLIGDDFISFDLTGEVLVDEAQVATELGKFGRFVKIAA